MTLPLPLWEGVGGRGRLCGGFDGDATLAPPPPPNPLPRGEGESHGHYAQGVGSGTGTGPSTSMVLKSAGDTISRYSMSGE